MSGALASLLQASRQQGPAGLRAAARLMSTMADEPVRVAELIYEAAIETGGMPTQADSLADRLWPPLLLGVTGAPGAGKSTLVDSFLTEYRRRYPERRVGVVAVDPSSPFTGGAVLGDRVRMMRHATDPQVFIRSLASRGHLGGLALGVRGVVRVMALIGCELVVLETVGVGQREVEVARVADLVAVVLAPGQGDGVQMLKAGLLEIADLLVVNKADRPEAARLHGDVLAAVSLSSQPPRVLALSAQSGEGLPAFLDELEELAAARCQQWRERRRHALALEAREAVLEQARALLEQRLQAEGPADADLNRLLRGEASIPELAAALVARTALQSE
jgi:LAO/AO transport system kinase